MFFVLFIGCSKDKPVKQYSLTIKTTQSETGNLSPSKGSKERWALYIINIVKF